MEPNLYPYAFVVEDSISVAGPHDPDLFPNERFKSSHVGLSPTTSRRSIPSRTCRTGFDVLLRRRRSVARGRWSVTRRRAIGRVKEVSRVCLVAHDTEETWFRVGRANFILDNLISQKKAVPMMVYALRAT